MVTKRIIPCLDVRDGRVVKGVNFQGLRDVSDPVALAEHYSRSGADELVFYDITASHEGRKLFTDILTKVASAIFIPLTVGGGIRGLDDFERVLACGADKVSVNSGAVRNPALIGEAARRYGDQCVVLSVDVKRVDGSYHVFLNGGRVDTGLDALEWVRRGVDAGAGEVVVNSMDTDGVKGGFDVELLRAVSRAVSVPVVASGGPVPRPAGAVRRAGGQHFPLRRGDHTCAEAGTGGGRGVRAAVIDVQTLKFDEKGLIPAIVQDAETGRVLTLAYMNRQSLAISLEKGLTCFWSRSRQELWLKGETSGNYQHIVELRADCDRDALLIRVRKEGPACHLGTDSCFDGAVFFAREER